MKLICRFCVLFNHLHTLQLDGTFSSGNTCLAELSLLLEVRSILKMEHQRDRAFFEKPCMCLYSWIVLHNKMTLCKILIWWLPGIYQESFSIITIPNTFGSFSLFNGISVFMVYLMLKPSLK